MKILAVLAILAMSFAAVGVVSTSSDETIADGTDCVAKIGDQEYPSLAAAVESVTDSSETLIILQKDGWGSAIIIPSGKNIEIDFKGHSYNVFKLPSSTETETQCFQLSNDSTIVMKNGTIKGYDKEITMIIQNYADLTLKNMVLDSIVDNVNVTSVLSSNCGEVSIEGDTSILAKEGMVALDVCWAENAGDDDGTQVTVETTGTVKGKIVYGLKNTATTTEGNESSLTIKKGNFDGEFVVGSGISDEVAKAKIKIEGGSFTDLSGAVKYVQTGKTIKLLKDCTGKGVMIESGCITIDFDGHTYTVDSEPAGSTGTKNQCFQLLKGSEVHMMNGAIVASSDDIEKIVQNYSKLTLTDMTLDANVGENIVGCVLSCSNNTVNIEGKTSISAKENGVAFAVCWAENAGDDDGTQVTVETTGTIKGKIVYGLWNDATTTEGNISSLTIKNGNFDGEFVVGSGIFDEVTKPKIKIMGGSFTDISGFNYLTSNSSYTFTGNKTTDLVIESGKTLINNGTLKVNDSITNNGTITNNSTFIINSGKTYTSSVNSKFTNNGIVIDNRADTAVIGTIIKNGLASGTNAAKWTEEPVKLKEEPVIVNPSTTALSAGIKNQGFVTSGSDVTLNSECITTVYPNSDDKSAEIEFPKGTVIPANTVIAVLNESTETSTKYEVRFTGVTIPENSNIKITVPYESLIAKNVNVFFIGDDGKKERMNVTAAGANSVTFETTHNSTYEIEENTHVTINFISFSSDNKTIHLDLENVKDPSKAGTFEAYYSYYSGDILKIDAHIEDTLGSDGNYTFNNAINSISACFHYNVGSKDWHTPWFTAIAKYLASS